MLSSLFKNQGCREVLKLNFQTSGVEDYVVHIRTLVKNSSIYVFASAASPLVSLILLPFLTHTLSRTEYGALAVLNTVIALMVGITQLGLNNAFFRAYSCDYESRQDRLGVVSTVVILLSLISFPIACIAILAAPWLAATLLNSSSMSGSVRLAALVLVMQNLVVPGLSWLRAENRAAFYSALSIINLSVNLCSTLVLVGFFHMGMSGALLAIVSGYGAVVACTIPVILFRAGLRLRLDITRNLLSFGIPLASVFVSVWVLQLSDRYLLSRFGSLAETASYAVAYSLGGALSIVILSPFSLAWPSAMFTIAKRDDAAHIFRLVFRWFSIILLFATFALSLLGIGVLNILFPPSYHAASPLVPIVAISIMFYGIYNFFTVGVGVRRMTWLGVIFTTLAALINVGLNLILIPRNGSMGAALSTLIAYAALAVMGYISNQAIYPIPFDIGTFIIALCVGVALFVGSSTLAHTQPMYGVLSIYCIALGLYAGCLVLLGKFSTHIYRFSAQLVGRNS